MKLIIVAVAALSIAAPAAAQTRAAINPDGRDIHGHNPRGQAFAPPGYNMGVAAPAYAPMTAAPAGMIGGAYPPCSAQNTDRCEQTYVTTSKSMSRKRMNRSGRR